MTSATTPEEHHDDTKIDGEIPVSVSDGVHTSDPYGELPQDGLFPPPQVPLASPAGEINGAKFVKALGEFMRQKNGFMYADHARNDVGYNNLAQYSRAQDVFIDSMFEVLRDLGVM